MSYVFFVKRTLIESWCKRSSLYQQRGKGVLYFSYFCHKKQNLKFDWALLSLQNSAKQSSWKAESFRALAIATILLTAFLIIFFPVFNWKCSSQYRTKKYFTVNEACTYFYLLWNKYSLQVVGKSLIINFHSFLFFFHPYFSILP